MHNGVRIVSAIALIMAQLSSVPALAQVAAQPLPEQIPGYRPPQTRPLPPPTTRPTPLPGQPGGPQIQPPRPNRPPPGGWNGGNQGGNWNGGNNGGWNGGNQGGNWSGNTVRCESRGYRYAECRADTRGGVRLQRVLGGDCQRRNWGYNSNVIWVNNGCRADFQTRYGNGGNNGGGGPSTGAIIGGVAIAAGLAALLASSGNKSAPPPTAGNPATGNPAPVEPAPWVPPPGSTGQSARITANTGGVTPSARPSLDTCLQEAARQIGATGGTEIRLDRLDDIEQGNGGYRFRFQLIAVYPDETRTIPTFCRATPTTLVELSFG